MATKSDFIVKSGIRVSANATISGNVSANVFSGNGVNLTSVNASSLGGVAAASYVQNTDSRTLSGNLYFTGANVVYSTGLKVSNTISVNTTSFFIGNSTVNATINSTSYSGAANSSTYANSSITNTFTVGTGTYFVANGNVGIGTTNPAYKLEVAGSFAAQTKSFVINHPSKPGMMLRHGSLEGPENGVYVRGRLYDKSIIELPDYWWNLIDESTITVNLTPIGRSQDIWVQSVSAYFIHLNQPAECFFTVFAERKDVDKLVVEF